MFSYQPPNRRTLTGPTTLERKDREARKASERTRFFAAFARFAFDVVLRCYRFIADTALD